MEPLHVVIEGGIGAGKSRLATAMATALGVPYHPEPVEENPCMEDFYRDMKSHSLEMEMWCLYARIEQHRGIVSERKGGVQDRSVYADMVFARMLTASGNMTPRQLSLYESMVKTTTDGLRYPDAMVYLDVTPETCLGRIKERGRPAEAGITVEYLTSLRENYTTFLHDIGKRMPVIVVPWERFGSVELTARVVLEAIQKTTEPIRIPEERLFPTE